MKRIFIFIIFFICSISFPISKVLGQRTDTISRSQSIGPVTYNAGFDVIIKKNGDIVYGLVKEVTLGLVIYQRTDIPDGPLYNIPRVEVYAISYRNQVKDILAPLTSENNVYENPNDLNRQRDYNYRLTRDRLFNNGVGRLGFGFFRSYTKVKDASEYATSATFPVVSAAYDVAYNRDYRIGVQIGFGSHNFSRQSLSLYDSTQNSVKLKENIFAINVYGRYDILRESLFALRPYVLVGIGLNTSHIKSETTVNFINNTDQVLMVSSGTRAASLGFMGRAGVDYFINQNLRAFLDAGVGTSIINIGLAVDLR
ncbi:MAG: outer membrane beta-barrel protein [Ferruginibacter sp.]